MTTFYVYTLPDSGKAKRIRNNPKVRINPCTMRGDLRGAWVDARARICAGDEVAKGQSLLNQKYGLMKRIGDFFSRMRGRMQMRAGHRDRIDLRAAKEKGHQHFCRWPSMNPYRSTSYADIFLRNTPASPAIPVPSIRNVEGSGTALANCAARIGPQRWSGEVIPEEILVGIAAGSHAD